MKFTGIIIYGIITFLFFGLSYTQIFIFTFRDVLTADSNVVDLFKLCKHFYLFGKFLSQLEHREAHEVRRTLIQVLMNTNL